MKYRGAWLAAGGFMLGLGGFALACSSSSTSGDNTPGDDSGADTTLDQATDHGNPADQMMGDAPVDTNMPDTPMGDAGDGGMQDGPLANCSPVNGPACDLVSQNCPAMKECVLALAGDGGYTTACAADMPSEHLPKGKACCPSGNGNPCLPGLECIGNPCVDGGGGGGRCTPHCCLSPDGGHDDTPCGSSVPEGFPGSCNLNIVGPNNPNQVLYSVCTYPEVCVPLHVQPCTMGNGCIVQDMQGTAKCTQIFNPEGGAGLGEGKPCSFANECADGLMCLGTADGGFACTWLCYVTGQMTPFDAGVLNNQPGYGGCPGTEQCFSATSIFPPWLGICAP